MNSCAQMHDIKQEVYHEFIIFIRTLKFLICNDIIIENSDIESPLKERNPYKINTFVNYDTKTQTSEIKPTIIGSNNYSYSACINTNLNKDFLLNPFNLNFEYDQNSFLISDISGTNSNEISYNIIYYTIQYKNKQPYITKSC